MGGCSDDDAPGDDAATDAQVDAATDAGDSGPNTQIAPLAVEVVTYSLSREGQEQPGVGALVEVRQADGTALQLHVDAAGLGTFEAVDFGPGPVSVTAHLPDHALVSVVAVTAADSPLPLRIKRPIPIPPAVTLSGTTEHMASSGNIMSVTTSRPVGLHHAVGPDYSVDVEQGRPFSLVAAEWWPGMIRPSGRGINNTIFHWFYAEMPALDDATTLDLDLDSSVTPRFTAGSFPVPTRADSPFQTDGIGIVGVTSRDSNQLFGMGLPTHADFTADGTGFVYELEWVEVPTVTDPVTLYLLVNDPWQVDIWAFVLVEGYPTAGYQDVRFFDMPDVLQPGIGGSQGLHDAVRWAAYDTDYDIVLQVYRYSEVAWEVYRRGDAEQMIVPPVPEGLDPATLLGSDPLDAQLVMYELDPEGNWLHRATFTDYFTLRP